MDSRSNSRTSRHKRPLIVGSFVALLVVSSLAFAVTGASYFATEKAKGDTLIDGTVTDYRLDESTDTPEIVVDVEIENPTVRPVVVDSANVDGLVNGTTVARASRSIDEQIPAGESKTITLRLIPRDEHRSTAIEAAESDSLRVTGIMWSRIERFQFDIHVAENESTGGELA